jgi:hypothetical protein
MQHSAAAAALPLDQLSQPHQSILAHAGCHMLRLAEELVDGQVSLCHDSSLFLAGFRHTLLAGQGECLRSKLSAGGIGTLREPAAQLPLFPFRVEVGFEVKLCCLVLLLKGVEAISLRHLCLVNGEGEKGT